MSMIEEEDATWARALTAKLLTVERIFTWPEDMISDIFRRLPLKNLGCVVKKASPSDAEKILKFMSHGEKRKLDDEMAGLNPKPEEVFATYVKVVEITRKMIKEGEIRVEKFDPAMVIPEGYESNLLNDDIGDEPTVKTTRKSLEAQVSHAINNRPEPLHASGTSGGAEDVVALQRMIQSLKNENRQLREELTAIRTRLDQIKKIA